MKIIMLIEKNEQGNKEMVCMPLLFHSPGFFFPYSHFTFFLFYVSLTFSRMYKCNCSSVLMCESRCNGVMISHAEIMDIQFVN